MTNTVTVLSAIGLAAAVAGCSPMVATRGHMLDEDRLALIEPGETDQNQVAMLLGTPTATATFDDNTWYYIGQRTEQVAFFKPEVTERNVVIVKFDDSGRVADLAQLDESAGRQIDASSRVTPTAGRELSFLEQMIGNVGRFSKPAGN